MSFEGIPYVEGKPCGGGTMMGNIAPVGVVTAASHFVFDFHEVSQKHGLGGFAVFVTVAVPTGATPQKKGKAKD